MKLAPPADKGETPVTSFVQLERHNAIRLVQHVHGSLAALSKVIKGTTLLTAETQNLATSLMKQEVCNHFLTCYIVHVELITTSYLTS